MKPNTKHILLVIAVLLAAYVAWKIYSAIKAGISEISGIVGFLFHPLSTAEDYAYTAAAAIASNSKLDATIELPLAAASLFSPFPGLAGNVSSIYDWFKGGTP